MFRTNWRFQQSNGVLPIIEAKCEDAEKITDIMIRNAVEIIDMASKFKGIPCQMSNPYTSNNLGMTTVLLSILFPSDKELTSFIEAFQRRK